MPRSDRIYVFIVVGLASILVIISIVATVMALTGSDKTRPSYESAPASALVNPDPVSGSIIDLDNAQRPPIDDQTYLVLHRATRLLALRIAAGKGYGTLASEYGLSDEGRAVMISERQAMNSTFIAASPNKNPQLTIYRPTPGKPGEQLAKTVAAVTFKGQGSALSTEFRWRLKNNVWRLEEVQMDLRVEENSSASPTNPEEQGPISEDNLTK